MLEVNPFFSTTMSLEVAEALRRAGEKDGALDALARAVDAANSTPTAPDLSDSPLWDRMSDRLDPGRAGEAWAAHKAHQTDEVVSLMRCALVEEVTSPEWRDLAGDDPRYQEIVAATKRLLIHPDPETTGRPNR